MFAFFIEVYKSIGKMISDQKKDEQEPGKKPVRRGPIDWAVNTIGDTLIKAGRKLKSWYADTKSQGYVPVIHIE